MWRNNRKALLELHSGSETVVHWEVRKDHFLQKKKNIFKALFLLHFKLYQENVVSFKEYELVLLTTYLLG